MLNSLEINNVKRDEGRRGWKIEYRQLGHRMNVLDIAVSGATRSRDR
jgi:hypothetical protein